MLGKGKLIVCFLNACQNMVIRPRERFMMKNKLRGDSVFHNVQEGFFKNHPRVVHIILRKKRLPLLLHNTNKEEHICECGA